MRRIDETPGQGLTLFFAASTFFQTCWSEEESVVMVGYGYRIRLLCVNGVRLFRARSDLEI